MPAAAGAGAGSRQGLTPRLAIPCPPFRKASATPRGNVHAVIGKMSFPEGDLVANLEHFIHAIEKVRPATAKGLYIKKTTISGAMTPGVQIKYVQAVAAE